jgi:hypothetical protein
MGPRDLLEDRRRHAPPFSDRWDLSKPHLILTSAKDFFGTYSPNYEENGLEEYGRIEAAYRFLQKPDHLQRFESPLPHGLSYVLRLEIYRWLTRWLQDVRKSEQEPAVTPEPDRNLWTTESGKRVDLPSLLQMGRCRAVPAYASLAASHRAIATFLAVEIPTAERIWAPVWVFVPVRPMERLLIVLDPSGRNAHWMERGLYQQLAAAGTALCTPDVRGIGDMRPVYSAGAPGYTGSRENEENYAWASLMLGRSLLGQRVTDFIALIKALSAGEWGGTPLLAARGQLTVPALCAAFLAPQIAGLYLTEHLISWRSLVETEMYNHPFANFIPNVFGPPTCLKLRLPSLLERSR